MVSAFHVPRHGGGVDAELGTERVLLGVVDEGVVDGDVSVLPFKLVLKELVPVALADAAGLGALFIEKDTVAVEGGLHGPFVDGPDLVELDDADSLPRVLQLVPGLRGLREQAAEGDEAGVRLPALHRSAGVVFLTVEDSVVVVGILVRTV